MSVEPMARVQMSRHERKFIRFVLVTEPAVTNWEMSFDDGTTWYPGEAVSGSPNNYRWLVAGNRVAIGTALLALGPDSYELTVRAIDNPELVVRKAILEVD